MNRRMLPSLSVLVLVAAACGERTSTTTTTATTTTATTTTATASAAQAPHPADEFLARLASHCGQAFAGTIVADEPKAENDPFSGKALVMHVRECSPQEMKVPFHVGDDHSRTWVLTRTDGGLRLKHDHRHADGTEDAVTMYGGDTTAPGTALRQEFPADQFSKDLFTRQGLSVSTTNTWAMEIEPGRMFAYELSRPGRLFRVEFDLTRPVAAPPTPWGHAEIE